MGKQIKILLITLVWVTLAVHGAMAGDTPKSTEIIEAKPVTNSLGKKRPKIVESVPPQKNLKTFNPSVTISEDRMVSFPSDI